MLHGFFDFSFGFGKVLLCKFFMCLPTSGQLGCVDPIVEVTLLRLFKQLQYLLAKLLEFFERFVLFLFSFQLSEFSTCFLSLS